MKCIKNIRENRLIKKSLFFLQKRLDKIKKRAKIVNHMSHEKDSKKEI